jgi:hypothetical protein
VFPLRTLKPRPPMSRAEIFLWPEVFRVENYGISRPAYCLGVFLEMPIVSPYLRRSLHACLALPGC